MAVSSVSRPAFQARSRIAAASDRLTCPVSFAIRSEEHTSELQSQSKLVCRLLLEKKKLSDDLSPASENTIPDTLLNRTTCVANIPAIPAATLKLTHRAATTCRQASYHSTSPALTT